MNYFVINVNVITHNRMSSDRILKFVMNLDSGRERKEIFGLSGQR